MNRNMILTLGIAAVVAETALLHGPLGAADRLAGDIEAAARAKLDYLEMQAVSARLARGPLRRQLILTGPADDFQRSELVRVMGDIPGVADVRWASTPATSNGAD